MATFFVGQRVRILFSRGWPELAGCEGRIVGVPPRPIASDGYRSDWTVAPDCWGSEQAPHPSAIGATRFSPSSDQLEPIQPSGHRAGDYSLSELLDRCRAGEGVAA